MGANKPLFPNHAHKLPCRSALNVLNEETSVNVILGNEITNSGNLKPNIGYNK